MPNNADQDSEGSPRPAARPGHSPSKREELQAHDPAPAGPHATPDLTDDAKTPGAGALPEETPQGDEADPGSG